MLYILAHTPTTRRKRLNWVLDDRAVVIHASDSLADCIRNVLETGQHNVLVLTPKGTLNLHIYDFTEEDTEQRMIRIWGEEAPIE